MNRAGKRRSNRSREVIPLRSAGGVVLRGEGEELRVALIRSAAGDWVFPKGMIEEAEQPEEAARREITEEVGLRQLTLRAPLGSTEHEFERDGKRFRNHLDWFLYQADPEAAMSLDPAEEVLECGWFTPRQALAILTFEDQRRLLQRALAAIDAEP